MRKNIYLLAVICIIIVALAGGCDFLKGLAGGGDEDGESDTASPYIVSFSPADGASDVPINTSITVEFSETMDESATEGSVTILPALGGTYVWSGQSTVLTFAPEGYLETDTTYTIKVSTDARDLAGNSLDEINICMFQTGSTTDTVAPGDVINFTATAGDGQVELSWQNPSDEDFTGVRVMSSTSAYPTGPDEGEEVYNGSGTGYTHTGLTNGTTYYYTIFAYDSVWNYSNGVQANAVPNAAGKHWTNVTNSAGFGGRGAHSSIVFDGRIWVIGGWEGNYPSGGRKSDVWYSTDGINWIEAIDPAPFSAREAHGSIVYNNKIWVIGGKIGTETYTSDVWYSSNGADWYQATSAAPFSPRGYFGCVVYDQKMWVISGYEGSGNFSSDVWYSEDGTTWTQATSLLPFSGRQSPECLVFNNKIWLIGGHDSTGYENDVWYYTNGENWIKVKSDAEFVERRYHRILSYDNRMWVIAGDLDNTHLGDVWYSSDGVTWTQATSLAEFGQRASHTSVVFGNKMWVVAGHLSAGVVEDVWYSP